MNVSEESESRPVLGPTGNKTRSAAVGAHKPALKALKKVQREEATGAKEKKGSTTPRLMPTLSAPSSVTRRQELLHSNLSMNASCSTDASTDSFCSRASTGMIGKRPSITNRKRPEKIAMKLEKIVPGDGIVTLPSQALEGKGKRRCSWITSNTDSCYTAFHDEEWGVPVHDDRKLFELLVLAGALAELTWPAILSKRHIFREVFMDFDAIAVSKLNEKKIVASGSTASSLLSEPKLRSIIENARQILEIIEEFGSFNRYCWGFVNHKPITNRFRYPRQVPVKTPKADVISKDLVKRGFRSVGPTVIYTFMQVSGMTNDHLISCYRFEECAAATTEECAAAITVRCKVQIEANNNTQKVEGKVEGRPEELVVGEIGLGLSRAVKELTDSLS